MCRSGAAKRQADGMGATAPKRRGYMCLRGRNEAVQGQFYVSCFFFLIFMIFLIVINIFKFTEQTVMRGGALKK